MTRCVSDSAWTFRLLDSGGEGRNIWTKPDHELLCGLSELRSDNFGPDTTRLQHPSATHDHLGGQQSAEWLEVPDIQKLDRTATLR